MSAEHPRDVLRTIDVKVDIGTFEPVYEVTRLQLRRDGSVTWTPIPLDELPEHQWTLDTKQTVDGGGHISQGKKARW